MKTGIVKLVSITCIISAVILSATILQAATISLNVADGNWTNSASWNPVQVPLATDDVRINNGGIARITTDAVCNGAYAGQGHVTGAIDISAGSLTVAGYLVAGQYGHGIITQSGGDITCANVRLGQNVPEAVGDYTLSDGTLNISGSMYIAQSGTGTVTQTGGTINLGTKITYVGLNAGSSGRYDISGGAYTGRLTVANNGVGYVKQSGGIVHIRNGFSLGAGVTGTGTYEMVGGTLIAEENMYVGGAGDGTFLFGDENTTGSIIETNGARRLNIGNLNGNGTGLFRGWGAVGLTGRLLLYGNGTVIADGYGVDRDLDLTTMNSTIQTYTNAVGEAGGFYARNHGKILFSPLNVGTYTYYVGESADNKTTNVVNCAVVTLNMKTGTTLSGAILASDRTDVNKNANLIGIWEFALGNPANLNSSTITFRYDDAMAAALGIAESKLELLRPAGDGWVIIPATIDATRHTITSGTLTNIEGQFAVGVRQQKGTVIIVN